MKVQFAGIELTSPVIAASGTFGYGIEFEEIVSLERIGAFVTKGISLEPMAGHPAPRILQTAAGMLNAIGLQNIGVAEFIEKKLPPLSHYPSCKVIVNVFGYTVGEYKQVVERLNDAEGIAAYELNVSCPNVHAGGMAFGSDAGSLEYLVHEVRSVSKRPLIIKLSPNVTSIAGMARVCASAGADAVSLVNTFLAMSIDVETRKPQVDQCDGRIVRSGYQADRVAHGVRSCEGSQHSRHWPRRHRHSRRCDRVHACRRNRRAGGHCQLCRSARNGATRQGHGILVPQPSCGTHCQPDRCD